MCVCDQRVISCRCVIRMPVFGDFVFLSCSFFSLPKYLFFIWFWVLPWSSPSIIFHSVLYLFNSSVNSTSPARSPFSLVHFRLQIILIMLFYMFRMLSFFIYKSNTYLFSNQVQPSPWVAIISQILWFSLFFQFSLGLYSRFLNLL